MTAAFFRQRREALLVFLGFALLTALFTAPLAFRLGSVAYRINNGDGQFSVWNTNWVARALVLQPTRVFDANIFYPHTGTLAYSEANLGSGALAVPVYWTTGNVYAAHGFVVLLSFLLSGLGTYYLVRYLTGDWVAAASAGIAFGFCPHVFAHMLHIQLVWTAGLPWSLLAFHRLADRPTPGRGVALGLVMTATLYLCAYYAVFLVLVVGVFTLLLAVSRGLWTSRRFWTALVLAGIVSVVTALPLLIPYVEFQRSTGFVRPLGASDGFSADWQAYFASSAYLHTWMLPWLGHWNEVLFPGFIALAFGLYGLAAGLTVKAGETRDQRLREATWLYGGIGILTLWASFGPTFGLYRLLYASVPAFTLMRAPSRFGIVVVLACVVLSGIGLALARRRWPRLATPLATALLLAVVIAEHATPLEFQPVPVPDPAYLALRDLPDGAVIEMPVYSERAQFIRAKYMLASTIHWKPIVNAYSDYIPADFEARMEVLGELPTDASLRQLRQDRVRYAVFHLNDYGAMRADLEGKLQQYAGELTLRYGDDNTRIYEIGPGER